MQAQNTEYAGRIDATPIDRVLNRLFDVEGEKAVATMELRKSSNKDLAFGTGEIASWPARLFFVVA